MCCDGYAVLCCVMPFKDVCKYTKGAVLCHAVQVMKTAWLMMRTRRLVVLSFTGEA